MIQIRANGTHGRVQRAPSRGSATSAVTVKSSEGVAMPKGCLWVPGEGWVRWCDLMRDVERAFDDWARRKSLEGVQLMDGFALREADIAEALANKGKTKS